MRDILRGFYMMPVIFHIRQTTENGQTFFEVWRKVCDCYGECWESLLAEATTRAEAKELQQHYADLETAVQNARKAKEIA